MEGPKTLGFDGKRLPVTLDGGRGYQEWPGNKDFELEKVDEVIAKWDRIRASTDALELGKLHPGEDLAFIMPHMV